MSCLTMATSEARAFQDDLVSTAVHKRVVRREAKHGRCYGRHGFD